MRRRIAAVVLIFVVALLVGTNVQPSHAQLAPYFAYGTGVPPGVTVAAQINGVECGSTTANPGGWVIVISSEDACHPMNGDLITFSGDGATAIETALW